jgi:hypothetical protein
MKISTDSVQSRKQWWCNQRNNKKNKNIIKYKVLLLFQIINFIIIYY